MNIISPSWNAVLTNSRACLVLGVVETSDAAEPPADIAALVPDPGELLLCLPIARRIRPAKCLAGSQGSAGVGTTAETGFDVQRNGISIATIRLASATDTATFIGDAETMLESGVALMLVAPATLDTPSQISNSLLP